MRQNRIEKITRAIVIEDRDLRATRVEIVWVDTRGKTGITSGQLPSIHMQQLLDRARRDGVQVETR